MSCPCTSTGHCLERTRAFHIFINGYGNFPVKHKGSCKVMHVTRNQASQKAVLSFADTRGYLILHHEAAQQMGYIHFPRITPIKLTQPPKTHAYLKATEAKAPKQKETGWMDKDLRHSNIWLLGGTLSINKKIQNLPMTIECILKEYNSVFSGI